jgi:hypothetical protein
VAFVADATKFTLPLLSVLTVAVTIKLVGAVFTTGALPFEQDPKDNAPINKLNNKEDKRTL